MNIDEFRSRARRFIDESEAANGWRAPWWYSAKLAEETGETVKAYNRLTGLGRKTGTLEELLDEAGDAVMAIFILVEKLEASAEFAEALDTGFERIMTRGFKEET